MLALQCKNSYKCVCILYELLAGFNFSPLPFAFWNRWTRARSRLRQGQSVQPASPAPRLTICPGHWANILPRFWPLLFAKWTNTLSPRRYYYASTYAHQLNILIFIFNFNKWSPSLMILPIWYFLSWGQGSIMILCKVELIKPENSNEHKFTLSSLHPQEAPDLLGGGSPLCQAIVLRCPFPFGVRHHHRSSQPGLPDNFNCR